MLKKMKENQYVMVIIVGFKLIQEWHVNLAFGMKVLTCQKRIESEYYVLQTGKSFAFGGNIVRACYWVPQKYFKNVNILIINRHAIVG